MGINNTVPQDKHKFGWYQGHFKTSINVSSTGAGTALNSGGCVTAPSFGEWLLAVIRLCWDTS